MVTRSTNMMVKRSVCIIELKLIYSFGLMNYLDL
jgi:hypothetical protein